MNHWNISPAVFLVGALPRSGYHYIVKRSKSIIDTYKWHFWMNYFEHFHKLNGNFTLSPNDQFFLIHKNFNVGRNFYNGQARPLKFYTIVHYHKSYMLTKINKFVMHFDKIIPLFWLWNFTKTLIVATKTIMSVWELLDHIYTNIPPQKMKNVAS